MRQLIINQNRKMIELVVTEKGNQTLTRNLAKTLTEYLVQVLASKFAKALTGYLVQALTGYLAKNLAENSDPQDSEDNQVKEADITVEKSEKDDQIEKLPEELS